MSEKMIARRYAQALFTLAQKKEMLEKVRKDLLLIKKTVRTSQKLQTFVNHHLIAKEAKKEVFKKIFAKDLSQITMNFLFLLTDKRREKHLLDILEEFIAYYNEVKNLLYVEVRSARKLTDAQIKVISGKLSDITEKDVRLNAKTDPDLIGGIVVKFNDRVYDGSVAGRLAALKESLRHADTRQIGVN